MLSALDDSVESDGSRSRRCALVRDPSDMLSASVEDLEDLSVPITDRGARLDGREEAEGVSMIDQKRQSPRK